MEMSPFSAHIWESRYRYTRGSEVCDSNISDTWRRVAAAVAKIEDDQSKWHQSFYDILSDYRFLPGGRILAGAGTSKHVTLFNCFVMGPIADSIDSIFDSLKEAATTMQQGGGIGCDFSTLRPAGSAAVASGATASGPVSFMQIWDATCNALLATTARRGAMMATLRCDHPDIEEFIDAKRRTKSLSNFNMSVLVTDKFVQAITEDANWQLHFPTLNDDLRKPESDAPYRSIPARQLWQQIVQAAHESAEPGVLFIDSINEENNLYYCEQISATNPCGEIPLPPHGACDLGSINLTAFVRDPFTQNARLDEQAVCQTASVAVRFLDNVIDISQFPLAVQADQARATRRIGLGITGLADMLVMLGVRYDSEDGQSLAERVMKVVRDAAYTASIELAKEKGTFPEFDVEMYCKAPFIRRLPDELQSAIAESGIRNSHLLAIAPTGTISLLANNVSSGIEPIYALEAERDVRSVDFGLQRFTVTDYAYALWMAANGNQQNPPDCFVTASELHAQAHLEMQSRIQRYVDNAISKTINLPASATVDDVAAIYKTAYELGVKGCTVYRSGARRGQVLRARGDAHCCDVEREAD
jgi:ribonucleoside-diphosphate reductase alpha chain